MFLNKIPLLLVLCFAQSGCTEQYVLKTNTYDEALVVEATITNELKKQEIKISKTYRFEEFMRNYESGAKVNITDNAGNSYEFEEQSGVYRSKSEFQAMPDRAYRLNIMTKDGRSYSSSSETLTTVNNIENITPTVTNKEGQRGVQINVNSYDPSHSSKYYRYEYEETYKIIAPYWDYEMTRLAPYQSGEPQGILVLPRVGESKTCFTTKKSEDIILTTTSGLSEDRVNFPIRFISNQNYIITHRYSILIWQFIQSLDAYTFYKTLNDLSSSESVLSPNQPGFFYGNIKSSENRNEKVIGFFDVSSVSSKRIFFNYEDLFPGEALPPYFIDCKEREFVFCFGDPPCKGAALLSVIGSNSLVHFSSSNITYLMVPPPCGDCTSFSSNIVPPFWVN